MKKRAGLHLIVLLFASAGPSLCQEPSWAPRAPASRSPLARDQHAMAYDTLRGRVVLFGGLTGLGMVNDTWEWDDNDWIEQHPVTSPGARLGHTMVYDSTRKTVIVFGGQAPNSTLLPDTWEWDGANWTPNPATGPSGRVYHAMAYDSARDRVVLFGGIAATGVVGDTWEFDGNRWIQMPVTGGPDPRYGAAMAYDSAHHRVILFGGYNTWYLNDTWAWDGAQWISVTPADATASPTLRRYHSMAYDSARGKIVLFGGNGADYDDTWEWDGTSWIQKTPPTKPQARFQHALAYDAAHGHVVLFGGGTPAGETLGDTWQYPGCSPFVDRSLYGRLIFPSLCSRDASILTQDVYGSATIPVYRGEHDTLYLSSDGMRFAPLIVDDVLRFSGADLLGPYTRQPGIQTLLKDVPIESNFVPVPAKNVTTLFSQGPGSALFESVDTDRDIFGRTAVYLVADCGLVLGRVPPQMNFISHDDQIALRPPEFDVRYGLITALRNDRDFRSITCFGHFFDTPAMDTGNDPPPGDAYYFLARGLSSGSCATYGDSTLASDPRRLLDNATQCPVQP